MALSTALNILPSNGTSLLPPTTTTTKTKVRMTSRFRGTGVVGKASSQDAKEIMHPSPPSTQQPYGRPSPSKNAQRHRQIVGGVGRVTPRRTKARPTNQSSSNGVPIPARKDESAAEKTHAQQMRSSKMFLERFAHRKRKSVGDYLVEDTLGEGTFGKVKSGRHVITGERVAIKILEKNKIKQVADVTRVSREIKILKRVRHENVIRLLQVIDTPEQIYLMTEYLDGGELFDYIVKKKRLEEKEACTLFLQIVDGVDYLHSINVIHRDLKPENLLMARRPNGTWLVKVADFGLSNLNEGGVFLKTACGSPCYAAPEMIAGEEYDGTKSDIWSLGVVLFALVCGYLPFEDENTAELYKKILSANYTCPSFLSPQVCDLLACILNTDPKTRYSMNEIRAHAWCQTQEADSSISQNDSESTLEEDLDAEVLDQLESLNLSREETIERIRRNSHDNFTASYFLLLERKRARLRREQEAKKPVVVRAKSVVQSPTIEKLASAAREWNSFNGTPTPPSSIKVRPFVTNALFIKDDPKDHHTRTQTRQPMETM